MTCTCLIWFVNILFWNTITRCLDDVNMCFQAGIPVHALTGGDDDNVPPLHTRKYARLANEYAADPGFVK